MLLLHDIIPTGLAIICNWPLYPFLLALDDISAAIVYQIGVAHLDGNIESARKLPTVVSA